MKEHHRAGRQPVKSGSESTDMQTDPYHNVHT